MLKIAFVITFFAIKKYFVARRRGEGCIIYIYIYICVGRVKTENKQVASAILRLSSCDSRKRKDEIRIEKTERDEVVASARIKRKKVFHSKVTNGHRMWPNSQRTRKGRKARKLETTGHRAKR